MYPPPLMAVFEIVDVKAKDLYATKIDEIDRLIMHDDNTLFLNVIFFKNANDNAIFESGQSQVLMKLNSNDFVWWPKNTSYYLLNEKTVTLHMIFIFIRQFVRHRLSLPHLPWSPITLW